MDLSSESDNDGLVAAESMRVVNTYNVSLLLPAGSYSVSVLLAAIRSEILVTVQFVQSSTLPNSVRLSCSIALLALEEGCWFIVSPCAAVKIE
jgi:hypothetical protein